MSKKLPTHPRRPENICWGCDSYCPADDLRCGNGTERTPHPIELFGEDWLDWTLDARLAPDAEAKDMQQDENAGGTKPLILEEGEKSQ